MKIAASTEEKNGICWFYRNTQAGAKGNFAKLQHVSLSASVHCSSFRAHSHLCAGKEKGEGGPCSSSSHLDCLCETKIVFLQLNVPNAGLSHSLPGSGTVVMLRGLLARAARVSHLSCPSSTPGTHSTALSDCTVCRHRKGRGTGEVELMGNKGKCAALLIRNTSTK